MEDIKAIAVDCISRADAIRVASGYCHPSNVAKELAKLPSVTPQEPTTKNGLGVDCISRAEAIKCLECDFDITGKENMKTVVNYINSAHDKIVNLPRVKQEPKTGHWISSHISGSILDECSECGFSCGAFTFNYCPNCGAKMVKPQESEDT